MGPRAEGTDGSDWKHREKVSVCVDFTAFVLNPLLGAMLLSSLVLSAAGA